MRDRLPPVWHGYLTRELQKLITRIKAGEVPDWSQDTVGPEYEAVEVSVELLGPEPEPVLTPLGAVAEEERQFAQAHGLMVEIISDYCPGCGTDRRVTRCSYDCPIHGDAEPVASPDDTDLAF